jgi:hypothetical protein
MPDGVLGQFRLSQHRDRVPVKILTCSGHSELTRCLLEQPQAEIALELLDAVTERRFGSPQRSFAAMKPPGRPPARREKNRSNQAYGPSSNHWDAGFGFWWLLG